MVFGLNCLFFPLGSQRGLELTRPTTEDEMFNIIFSIHWGDKNFDFFFVLF